MNHKARKILIFLLIAGGTQVFTSCKFFSSGEEDAEKGKPIARVYDRYLYQEDVRDIIPDELSENDSLAFLQNYINVWAKDQLMLYKAEYNLTENKKNFEEQIQEYRNDLLKFTYRQEFVRQNLDTNIAESELQEYYSNSENNLLLQENILKARYLVVDRQAPELKKALEWFKSGNKDVQNELEEYALKYAYRFSLDDSSWVNLDRIRGLMPVQIEDPTGFLRDNKLLELQDSTNVYLLEIQDYRLKGQKAPLQYSRDIIKNILLNSRKLELLNNLEQNLLNDALKKKEFELY